MNYFDEYYKDVKFYHEKEGEISIDALDNPSLCVIDFNIGDDPMYINFQYVKKCSKRSPQWCFLSCLCQWVQPPMIRALW